MKIFVSLFIIAFVLPLAAVAQKSKEVAIKNKNGTLKGTLLTPKKPKKNIPVVLLIAGSGPTDRNGNSAMTQNNSLRFLAEGLAEKGIASLRYDKQGVGGSANASKPEKELTFDDFVEDAVLWLKYLKSNKQFSSIIVAGHSEGSLLGMLACKKEAVDKFISIAGAGQSIDKVLEEQLSQQLSEVQLKKSKSIMHQLKTGKFVPSDSIPTELQPLFRESVQPFMISWLKHSPAELLGSLEIPVLIVNGTTDIQVGVEEAKRLKEANEKSQLVVIEGMNHIFKQAPIDREANIITYMDPKLPLHPDFLAPISKFILEN